MIADTDFCQSNVRAFAQAQLSTMHPLEVETRPGIILGHKHVPVKSVGCYIPGGRYPMFGSAQMSIIPAKVAGVKSVYAFTPPVKGQGFFPATVNAMKKAGADRIFILGGVPAFAMMAFGMGVFAPVDMLCGAGNKFVAEAKRQLYGRCGIDLLAGPTEIMVIADDSADPALVACDLLGQAEHDPNSGVALICFSQDFGAVVMPRSRGNWRSYPPRMLLRFPGGTTAGFTSPRTARKPWRLPMTTPRSTWKFKLPIRIIISRTSAITARCSWGAETTVAYGDKCIGTNHILPTSRAARYTGGLWVGKFLKTVTYQKMTPAASRVIGEVTERQCEAERMLAHAITARVRVERYSDFSKGKPMDNIISEPCQFLDSETARPHGRSAQRPGGHCHRGR